MAQTAYTHPYESAPPAAPPSDPELQQRIDMLVEYVAKNGPEFESMVCEKQRENPDYSFLFGGEGHNYYRYKCWLYTRPPGAPSHHSFHSSSMPMIPSSHNPMLNPSAVNPTLISNPAGATGSVYGAPQLHQPSYPPFYDQHQKLHSQPFMGQPRPDYELSTKSFKGLSGPLPSDVAAELSSVLINLTGTKESIKGAKVWFMQRSPFAPALAESLRDRIFALDDSERQMHIIFLVNDILFDSTVYYLLRSLVDHFCINSKSLAFGYLDEKLIDTGLMKFLGLCPSALSWYLEFAFAFSISSAPFTTNALPP
ncbi:hypothetical protein GW17_00021382 [Ensete ventricosum]|nr:hypothetical protein GW17_00021382 [Ensete ventricosum]